MENEYYVYAHITPIDKKIFYIGIGKNHRVIEGGRLRNKEWQKVVYMNKGFLFIFLHENITKEKALLYEQKYIREIGLHNLTNVVGEDGNSTAFKKGQTPWNKGLKMCQFYATKKVAYNGMVFNSIDECIKDLKIGKTTFYRWIKKNKIQYV
jgi:hypothetical protein